MVSVTFSNSSAVPLKTSTADTNNIMNDQIKNNEEKESKSNIKQPMTVMISYNEIRELNLRYNDDNLINIRRQVHRYLKGTALESLSDSFVDIGIKYKLEPRFIVAVACLESARGTSDFAKYRNNLFGLGAFTENPNKAKRYSSKENCIEDFCNIIINDYIGNNLISVDLISDIYCDNGSWSLYVKDIMGEIASK